jgi:hypothetical protein
MTETRTLGQGADGKILDHPDPSLVRKAYAVESLAESVHLARAEHCALQKLEARLMDVDRVRVPSSAGVDDRRGELLMEHSTGMELDRAITLPLFESENLREAIAAELVRALEVISEELDLDQIDVSLRNILVEVADDDFTLVLIDFTPRTIPDRIDPGTSALELALASVITSCATFQIRRSSIANRAVGARIQSLAEAVTRRLRAQFNFDDRVVSNLCWALFHRQRRNRGVLRWLWFTGPGRLMFSRLIRRTLGSSS